MFTCTENVFVSAPPSLSVTRDGDRVVVRAVRVGVRLGAAVSRAGRALIVKVVAGELSPQSTETVPGGCPGPDP